MKLTFVGADHEVTGSCHFIRVGDKNLILDYGMEQGRDTYVNQKLPVPEAEIDYVFLSHAHIDHSGYLPILYKNGFKGKIYSTEATADLCGIMLRDSAHIQEFEAKWRNRKAKRAQKAPYIPLYTMEDAEGILNHFVGLKYDEVVDVCDGIRLRFKDVGHLLGSASIELWLTENNETKKIVYSGDIGNINQPIIEDPESVEEADYVIMESTYGNRYHEASPDYITELSKIIQETFDAGGNVVIPAFAVGRTQEMLYFIRQIKSEKLIKRYNGFKVYIDSPLAIEAIKVFNENYEDCFDEEAMKLVKRGIDPISFPGIRVAVTAEDSQAINFDTDPKVIISASGMCEAGRIRHHLKHNLWEKKNTILFVGYQANGTLGRKLIDGERQVKLFGEPIYVNARIEKLEGVSGHADKEGLLKWINSFKIKPQKVFVVHGDTEAAEDFTKCLKEEYGFDSYCPYSGTEFDLLRGTIIKEGISIPIKKVDERDADFSASFETLEKRLRNIFEKSKVVDKNEILRLTKEICKKFEK